MLIKFGLYSETMTTVDQRNCIGDDIFGLRGVCTTSKYYIDDLPGINVINLADIVDGAIMRPEELVNKCFGLAKERVLSDLKAFLQKDFSFNELMEETQIDNAGTDSFFGLQNINLGFKFNKWQRDRKVIGYVKGFEIVSDREVEAKVFHIDVGGNIYDHTQSLVKGLNYIDLEVFAAMDFRVYWNMSDFKIGKRDDFYINFFDHCRCSDGTYGVCHSTELVESSDLITWTANEFGITIATYCKYNTCKWLSDYLEALKMPLMYATGINLMYEAKTSSRVNAYTRNAVEKIDALIVKWNGGTDTVTGFATKGEYWKSIETTYNGLKGNIVNSNKMIFSPASNRVINSLPG